MPDTEAKDVLSREDAHVCGRCLLPIHHNEAGIRHFGFFLAHSDRRCIELLRAQLASALEALKTLQHDVEVATMAMPVTNATTHEDRIDWLCGQIAALEAQQKAERERDIAKDHWQGYHADCRIYERDLKAIQEAYAQLLAGKNSGASATVDDANHETLYDAIDRSSQQTPEPEVVPRECLPPSPLLKVYEDPEFQKEWVSALEEPQNISRLIRERDEARAAIHRHSNPWTVEIQDKITGNWQEFAHDAPLTLAEVEARLAEYQADSPRASFRIMPRLNPSQFQEIVVPLRAAIQRLTTERDEAVRVMDDATRQNAAQVDRLVAEQRRLEAEKREMREDKEAAYMRGFADGTTGMKNAIDIATKATPKPAAAGEAKEG